MVMLLIVITLSITLALILPHIKEREKTVPPIKDDEDAGMPAWTATLEDIGKTLFCFTFLIAFLYLLSSTI